MFEQIHPSQLAVDFQLHSLLDFQGSSNTRRAWLLCLFLATRTIQVNGIIGKAVNNPLKCLYHFKYADGFMSYTTVVLIYACFFPSLIYQNR